MSRARFFTLFWISSLIGVGACHPNTFTLPAPAQAIAGVYQSTTTSFRFPLVGQAVRLSIRPVKPDSAAVKVYALVNNQVTDSLTYPSALVGQEIGNSCVSYRIYLPTGQRVDQLVMSCGESNVFQYYRQTGTHTFDLLLKLTKQ